VWWNYCQILFYGYDGYVAWEEMQLQEEIEFLPENLHSPPFFQGFFNFKLNAPTR